MRSSTILLALAALAPTAFATLFITSPVATTSCAAGAPCTISWEDRNGAPTLATIGLATVGLYVGNAQQQTLLQLVNPTAINVATTASVTFNPDASVGPNESIYFIRFTATSFMDPTAPTFPFEAFSAKFTLTGMTGVFNATVLQQIAGVTGTGATGAPATTGAATTSAGGATTSAAATTKASSAGGATTKASAASSAASATKSGAALPRAVAVAGQAVAAAGALVAAVAFC